MEVLNIIRETRRHFEKTKHKRPALLATQGTLKAGLYQREFANIKLILPDSELIRMIHDAIMWIKAGRMDEAKRILFDTIDIHKKRGADSVILGCTDIALAFDLTESSLPTFDSGNLLAISAVARCMCD